MSWCSVYLFSIATELEQKTRMGNPGEEDEEGGAWGGCG